MKPLTLVILFAGLAPFAPRSGGLAAQSDPRLTAAVRLAQDGLSDSARAVTGRLLDMTLATDSLYPEILFTAGLLAATEQDRRLYLRRVVLDYAISDWADDALLHLGQLDYTMGNTEAAVRQIDQLLRDYPGSPLFSLAAFWGSRAAGDRRDATTSCRMAEAGLAVVGTDIELKNLLDFQRQRCSSLAAFAAESLRAAVAESTARTSPPARPAGRSSRTPPPPAAPPSAAAPSGAPAPGFYVQTSAVTTEAAATAEIARIKRAGFTPIMVREAGFLKIRVGAYRTRAEAQAASATLSAKLRGAPFVVRVP